MAAYMGTELNMAYAEPISPRPQKQTQSYEQQRSMMTPPPPTGRETMSTPISALQIPQVPLTSPENMYDVGQTQQQQVQYEQELSHLQREVSRYSDMNRYGPQTPGLFESMWMRRRDIMKLVCLSLVVVLALAFHSSMEYYLKQYILENDMTSKQELLLRFAYPLVILLFLWVLKTWYK
jgi:hypothetical protein